MPRFAGYAMAIFCIGKVEAKALHMAVEPLTELGLVASCLVLPGLELELHAIREGSLPRKHRYRCPSGGGLRRVGLTNALSRGFFPAQ